MVAFFLLFGFNNNKGTQNKKGKRVLVGYLATPTASLPSRVEAASHIFKLKDRVVDLRQALWYVGTR